MGPSEPRPPLARSTDRGAGSARRARPGAPLAGKASSHLRRGAFQQSIDRSPSCRDTSAGATRGDCAGAARNCSARRGGDQAASAGRCNAKRRRCRSVDRSADTCSRARWPAARAPGARRDRCETFRRTLVGRPLRALPVSFRDIGAAERSEYGRRGLGVSRSRLRSAGRGAGRRRSTGSGSR